MKTAHKKGRNIKKNRISKGKKIILKNEWENKFAEKLKTVHIRNIEAKTKKLLRKVDRVYRSMRERSKKHNVEFSITVEDLRELLYNAYGTPCKYSGRILTIDNSVYDHKIPISRGGPSTRENIQIISKFSNNQKSALSEDRFKLLLGWLETLPEDLKKYVAIKLAGGKYTNSPSVEKINSRQLLLETTGDLLH